MFRIVICFLLLELVCSESLWGQTGHNCGALSAMSSSGGRSVSNLRWITLRSTTHPEYPDLKLISIQTALPKSTIVLIVDTNSVHVEGEKIGSYQLFASPDGCLGIASIMPFPDPVLYVQNPATKVISALFRIGDSAAELKLNQVYLFTGGRISMLTQDPQKLDFPENIDSTNLRDFSLPILKDIAKGEPVVKELPQRKWKKELFVEETVKKQKERMKFLFDEEDVQDESKKESDREKEEMETVPILK